MKRSVDPFRAIPILTIEETVLSVAPAGDSLYVGTSAGNLLKFTVESEAIAPGSAEQRAAVRLSNKRSVDLVAATEGLVFALCDGILHVLPPNIDQSSGTALTRDAKHFCLQTTKDGAQNRHPQLCVSTSKRLVLYCHNGSSYEMQKEFQAPEAALSLVWHHSWICAGFKKEYRVYSDRNGLSNDLCPVDGKYTPTLTVVSEGQELLVLSQEHVGVFFSPLTQQRSYKNPIVWPKRIVSLGVAGPYLLGATSTGQVEVVSVRDQRSCQSLALGAPVASMASVGTRIFVACEGSVVCLDPLPYDQHIDKLLLQVRIEDALTLMNVNFGPEHPRWEGEMHRFHVKAGWALFKDLQFKQAFVHIMYSRDFNLVRLLLFWKRYLPASFEQTGVGALGKAETGEPEPSAIESFVQARLQARQHQEGGDKDVGSAVVKANVEMANAAVVTFFIKQRDALLAQDREPSAPRTPPRDPAVLLRAVDTVVLKLLVETHADDKRLREFLDGDVRCVVEDLQEFLRGAGRHDILARLFKARNMHDAELREWRQLLARSGSDEASGVPSRERVVSEMVSALANVVDAPRATELLREHVPGLLAVEPSAVLRIFTGAPKPGLRGGGALRPDDVIQLLGSHEDLIAGYLEHLVLKTRNAEPHHRSRLALMYVAQVERERAGNPRADVTSPSRAKLLLFLEEADDFDTIELLQRIEALELHEERAVICAHEKRHEEALQILVEVLDDLPRAEQYCRMVMATKQRGPGAQRKKESPSLFSDEPPVWARPIAFAGRPQNTNTGGTNPGGANDGERDAAKQECASDASGVRPLLLFLKALLAAHRDVQLQRGKYRRTVAGYQEAVLALLTAYAAHRDLPPHEVMGLLPSDWPLAVLSGYLSKATRSAQHERRASMLEENLSSMAYLKTFKSWAHERMRKVHITGDRCCPVCNRRFVGKDSVGKAFIAYPNETCVHLQCKEDLSVCPKTGRSFADNLSVFCRALDTE